MIPQNSRQKLRHARACPKADADPFSVRRTIHCGCQGLRSTQGEEVLSSQSRDSHLKTVCRNREKAVRSLAVATPDLFNKRMIRSSVFEMDEVSRVLHLCHTAKCLFSGSACRRVQLFLTPRASYRLKFKQFDGDPSYETSFTFKERDTATCRMRCESWPGKPSPLAARPRNQALRKAHTLGSRESQ